MINITIKLKERTKSYLLVGLQDISSMHKKSLHFHIVATNYLKIKLSKKKKKPSTNVKHFGINLTKFVQDLYT